MVAEVFYPINQRATAPGVGIASEFFARGAGELMYFKIVERAIDVSNRGAAMGTVKTRFNHSVAPGVQIP